ncbi:MAG: DUF4375 domain-containing protein [Verrucomicrobiota bacterium]
MLKEKPLELWNAFVDIAARENYADLDGVRRVAHLSFWYEAEVQNGGHLQYFENRGSALLDETLAALRALGANCQRGVLEEAGHVFLAKSRARIVAAQQYVVTALTGEFDALDSAYYACEPSIHWLLERYLKRHREHFIEIADE